MRKSTKALIVSVSVGLGGCASVTPPPDRVHWDSAPASTQCTDEKSGVVGQYAGSLLASGLGGWDIGAGLALGHFPVVGIGLAAVGIAGGSDAGNKFKQIEQCKEFKEYVAMRENRNPSHLSDLGGTARARLLELSELLDEGTITQDEHDEARQKILSEF